jgi:hypothetical protein
MERQVWSDDEVMSTVNAAFIPVTIDVDNPDAAETLGRYWDGVTPTTIITDANGHVLRQKQGRMGKVEFLELLGELVPSASEGF